MLECSGAASAVNADVLCCKDGISEGISFLFLHISLSGSKPALEHAAESTVIYVHV